MTKRRTAYLLAAGVSLATLILYLPALRNGFVSWDDPVYVYENARIRSLDWSFIVWAFSDYTTAAFWHPLTWLSHALDHALWGMNPSGHHLTSILLHAVNAFLAVLLIIRLLESANRAKGPAEQPQLLAGRPILIASVTAGALFGIHPLHVESAAWISERKDLLCALFFMLSVMAYTGFAVSPKSASPNGGSRFPGVNSRYYLSLAFFFLALSGKSMAVTVPLVLLLLDWHPFGRLRSVRDLAALAVEKLPFFVLSLGISFISIAGQKEFGALTEGAWRELPARALVACNALISYLVKMAVPVKLLPFYPYPEGRAVFSPEYPLSLVLVLAVTAACLIVVKKHPVWTAVWGYYLVTLLPVLGFIKVGEFAMADRYTYLPSLGPFLVAGLGAARLWQWTGSAKRGGAAVRSAVIACALLLAGVLSHATVKQTAIWSSSISLWSSLVEQEPVSVPMALLNRGVALKAEGRVDEAVEDFTRLIRMDRTYPSSVPAGDRDAGGDAPDRAAPQEARMTEALRHALYLAYNNRGATYQEQGKFGPAHEDFTAAARLYPDEPMAYVNRGLLFGRERRFDRAIQELSTAISLNAGNGEAYRSRARIFRLMGRNDLALADYTAAIELHPLQADDYVDRGLLHEDLGRFVDALADFSAAVSIDPGRADAYNNRGVLFELMNRPDRALEDYGRALLLDPDDYTAYNNRASVYAGMGRIDLAFEDHARSIAANPDFARAYFDRGRLYQMTGDPARASDDFRKACGLGDDEACNAAGIRRGGERRGREQGR